MLIVFKKPSVSPPFLQRTMIANHPFRHLVSGLPLLMGCAMFQRAAAEIAVQDNNPISRIARVLSPQHR